MDEESDLLYKEFVESFLKNDCSTNNDNNNIYVNISNEQNKTLSTLLEDDDPNDPEYNVFQDIIKLDFDEFDFLYDSICSSENPSDPVAGSKSNDPVENPFTTAHIDEDNVEKLFPINTIHLIYYQLCFLVQNLTQNWILSTNLSDKKYQNEYRRMLLELDQKRCTYCEASDSSFLSYIPNLAPAITLILDHEKQIIMDESKCSFSSSLSLKSRQLFATRKDIFPFDWALPIKKMIDPNPSTNYGKTIFTIADDSMIAFALDQLNKSKLKTSAMCESIHSKYLPSHSPECILNHLRNLKRGKTNRQEKGEGCSSKFNELWSNPIVYYLREKRLKPFDFYLTEDNLPNIHKIGQPPKWYAEMKSKEEKPLCIDEEKKDVPKLDSKFESNLPIYPKPLPIINFNFGTVFNENFVSMYPFSPTLIDPGLNVHLEEIKRISQKRKSEKYEKISSKRKKSQPKSVKEKNSFIDFDNGSSNGHKMEKCAENDTVEVVQSIGKDCDSKTDEKTVGSEKKQSKPQQGEIIEWNYDEDIYDGADEEIEDDDISYEENELISTEKINEEDGNLVDDENDLIALMEASWTTVSNRNANANKPDVDGSKRKADLLALQRDSSRFLLKKDLESMEGNQNKSWKELLISYYLKRTKKLLLVDDYTMLLELIVSFINDDGYENDQVESKFSNKEIAFYEKIKSFLIDTKIKYSAQENLSNDTKNSILDGIQELIELLVLFLDSSLQAQACGQSFEYLHWKKILDFFNKVELYLSFIYSKRNQQHSCIQKMVRSFNQSLQYPQMSYLEQKSKIKATVSKILNNHPLLMKEFSSLFLDETIAPYIYSDDEDFEDFVISDENSQNELENVSIPINEIDLKYGTNDCPCSNCHESLSFGINESNITKHCRLCCIRFISGRIYLPQLNNKKLQLVEYVQDIHTLSPVKEENLRKEWTLDEDRLILQVCRSMIVNSNITKLTEEVVEKIAMKLSKKRFQYPRSLEEISRRLLHLIEMLTISSDS